MYSASMNKYFRNKNTALCAYKFSLEDASLQFRCYRLEVIGEEAKGEENEQTKEKIDENNNKINNIVESHRV